MRLTTNMAAPSFHVTDIYGQPISLDVLQTGPVLLSFMRFAACPFCNLRLWYLHQRFSQYQQYGLTIIVVFVSSPQDIQRYVLKEPLPFTVIADPERKLYDLYQVERSWRKWLTSFPARIPDLLQALQRRLGGFTISRNTNALPADFIIDSAGTIRKAYYGKDVGDHLPLEEIDAFLIEQSSQ